MLFLHSGIVRFIVQGDYFNISVTRRPIYIYRVQIDLSECRVQIYLSEYILNSGRTHNS